MKRVLVCLIFVINNYSFGQTTRESTIDTLKYKSNTQNRALLQKLNMDYISFDRADLKAKIDSIKEISRNELIKNLIGEWRYVKSKCNHCVKMKKINQIKIEKIISISIDSIKIYSISYKKRKELKGEKIKFTEQTDQFSVFTDLVFPDKTLWSYDMDNSKRYLRVINTGKETKRGRTRQVYTVSEYYKKVIK